MESRSLAGLRQVDSSEIRGSQGHTQHLIIQLIGDVGCLRKKDSCSKLQTLSVVHGKTTNRENWSLPTHSGNGVPPYDASVQEFEPFLLRCYSKAHDSSVVLACIHKFKSLMPRWEIGLEGNVAPKELRVEEMFHTLPEAGSHKVVRCLPLVGVAMCFVFVFVFLSTGYPHFFV